jgi:hypothetical protein
MIKFILLIAGIFLMVMGHYVLALIALAFAIGIQFIASLVLIFVGIILVLGLSGCGTIVSEKNVYIDNSVKIESPCGRYGDRCVIIQDKPKPRNPHNPYKEQK